MQKSRENLPTAIPLERDWDPDPDYLEVVGGSHGQDRTLKSLDEEFLASTLFKLERKILSDVFPFPDITPREFEEIEKVLGATLDTVTRRKLQASVVRFIAGVGLARQVPPWRNLKARLELALQGATLLLRATAVREHKARAKGFLSVDETMQLFFRSFGLDTSDLERFVVAAEERLAEIQIITAKRGRKGDVSFRVFMRSLVIVATSVKCSTNVPSNADLEIGEYKPSRLMKLAKLMLEIVQSRAGTAFSDSRLDRRQRAAALEELNSLCRKRDRPLVEQLRIAKEAVLAG